MSLNEKKKDDANECEDPSFPILNESSTKITNESPAPHSAPISAKNKASDFKLQTQRDYEQMNV